MGITAGEIASYMLIAFPFIFLGWWVTEIVRRAGVVCPFWTRHRHTPVAWQRPPVLTDAEESVTRGIPPPHPWPLPLPAAAPSRTDDAILAAINLLLVAQTPAARTNWTSQNPTRPKGLTMATITHECAVSFCTARIALNRLMCGRHWHRVSTLLQRQVWATYMPGQEHDLSMLTSDYLAARAAAVAAVEAKYDGYPSRSDPPIRPATFTGPGMD